MALENRDQIEEFADKLSECANSIHDRLRADIKAKKISQSEAQSIFSKEQVLRQHADSLYIDAIDRVVKGLSESQASLIGLIGSAKEKIKTIERIASAIDLIVDLVVLAAAAYRAKPGPILEAV